MFNGKISLSSYVLDLDNSYFLKKDTYSVSLIGIDLHYNGHPICPA